MAKPLQIEGFTDNSAESDEDTDARLNRRQEQERIFSLEQQLKAAKAENARLARAISNLQTMLTPFHRALRMIFGEIEVAGVESPTADSSTASSASATDPRWDSFKRQFPGVPAGIIDALLVHGEMPVTHLAKFLKRSYTTVRDAAARLRSAGAINYVGGKVSLRR